MRLIVIASLLLASTSAVAAPAKPAGTDSDADSAARRAGPAKTDVRAVYDFDSDTVNSDALKPDHEVARTRVPSRHESMIKLRMHFIPQMVHMANDV